MNTLGPPSLLDRSPFLKATVGSRGNLALSVAVMIVAALLTPPLIRWLLIDATFLGTVGIPTYGIPGMWGDPDGNGAHGLNERMEVRSVYVGRDYMFDLVKAYADKT